MGKGRAELLPLFRRQHQEVPSATRPHMKRRRWNLLVERREKLLGAPEELDATGRGVCFGLAFAGLPLVRPEPGLRAVHCLERTDNYPSGQSSGGRDGGEASAATIAESSSSQTMLKLRRMGSSPGLA